MTESPHYARDSLARRVRALLSAHNDVVERTMFGGIAFMVHDRLVVSAGGDGDLLVRVDPAEYDDLLREGGIPAAMNAQRSMGRGWMNVPCDRIEADERLAFWVARGIESRTL